MESIFDKSFNVVKRYKEDKENGEFNSIPVPFPRLAKKFPGWERGVYSIFTANSGIGKTKTAKFFIITSIMRFANDNPNLDIHIRWYALEESETEFALSFISTALAVKYGIKKSPAELKSLGEFNVSDSLLDKIDEARTFLNKFLKNVTVIDDISNPYGIWKDVKEFANERGDFYYKNEGSKVKEGSMVNGEKVKGFNLYEPKNSKEFVFIVTDHISLLRPENKSTLHQSMADYSQKYCLGYMVKKLNYHVVNIQQQGSDQEKKQYTMKGQSIEEKVEPSLDGLANNKETQRDADLVWGIFAPTRYGIDISHGYKINPSQGGLGDRFRTIIFLKDRRYGLPNARIHTYFNGAINFFEELPKSDELTPDKYKSLLERL